jgi:hypothetical protein
LSGSGTLLHEHGFAVHQVGFDAFVLHVALHRPVDVLSLTMARDILHQAVREALEADGWLITHDPFILKTGGLRLEIDLAAEQVLAAERGTERIAVEVKSFLSKSKLSDFYEAKGQYDVYRAGLAAEKSDRTLYLAIDSDAYTSFFTKSLISQLVEQDKMELLVLNVDSKRIEQWITR